MNHRTTVGILLLPSIWCVWAYGAPSGGLKTRGVYGNIEYGYLFDNATNRNYTISQNSFTQRYTLGLRGFVYSPNLLRYLIQGSFFIRDIDYVSNGVEEATETKQDNYLVNADFIQASKTPISLYAEKYSTPFTSNKPGSNYSYYDSGNRYGIQGTVSLPVLNLNYSANLSDQQLDGSFFEETRKSDDYTVSMSKTLKQGSLIATYTDTAREYARKDKTQNYSYDWGDHVRDARVNADWKFSDTLQMLSGLTYRENSFGGLKSLGGNLNANWSPNSSLNGGIMLNANTMSAGGMSNKNVMLAANAGYRFSPEVFTNYSVTTNYGTGDAYDYLLNMGMMGISYTKKLENQWLISGNTNLMLKNEQFTSSGDSNMTLLPDRKSYACTIAAGASRMIESIRSNVSANVSYFTSNSSIDEENRRLLLNGAISTTFTQNFTNSISLYYTDDINTYFDANTDEMIQSDYTNLAFNNMTRYSGKVGIKGRFSLGAGVSYNRYRSNRFGSFDRFYPRLDGSFSYQILPTMMFNSNASVGQDPVNDLTNYSAYMGLNYSMRRIVMSMGGRYMLQAGQVAGDYKQYSMFANIARPF